VVIREESIFGQACNAVCLGEGRLLYYDLTLRIADTLRRHGFDPLLVPGSELFKDRGGPRCMTRPLYAKPLLDEPSSRFASCPSSSDGLKA
jgi:N-dimethylarginine dimethylaminohydrolase